MGLLSFAVSPELRPAFDSMTFGYKLCLLYVNLSDRFLKWHKVPVVLGLIYLELRRTIHQKYNLIAVGPADKDPGDEGSFIGRNIDQTPPVSESQLMEPHPAVVATKLLNRKNFVGTGTQFNMIATSWINFMIHDWIDHQEDDSPSKIAELVAPSSVAAQCPLKAFKFHPGHEEDIGSGKIGFRNTRSSWWDASMIYGTSAEVQQSLRTGKEGKLKISDDGSGLLQAGHNDIPLTGDPRNPWMGVAVLQSLFIAEHNLICDTIKAAHPTFDDETIYKHAKVTTQTVLAKIHTIDWTVQLLKMNTLLAGMRANWYGLLGKWVKDNIGSTNISLLSGIVGHSKTVDHGVPYSLTEEFTSVYRMHPLLPEKIEIRDLRKAPKIKNEPVLIEEVPLGEMIGTAGIKKARGYGIKTLLMSMGNQPSGALTLFNYPTWMRDLEVTDASGVRRTDHVDMAALEIYRDRSRRVYRYNEFRKRLFMPTIKSWSDLTDDRETIAILTDVYGNDVEKCDVLVGLLAEKKIKGYAISETAFYIFLLMATRRLEATPLFTTNFNEATFTKEGLHWVNTTEGLKDVLLRHHPEVVKSWMPASSAFSIWSVPADSFNPIPTLIRFP
ncbi:fatty acid alpha-dioxygenase [Marchantia polymorpha subsp. ruderalis]|uniref:Uncharacterized protein n=2 Tax=Marchantia polymorpha TaxID=3197 RepID=A0AAF6B3C1_MARPO|nr:hypothetical protein MARPO_0089s0042 [Marchantia polymorpha]BBN06505.1 hypothetical protein Mp_3g21740 [Marchantia polymorpha subsp. ruderalis]|eukprot:PTQ33414.1 hypothetical protein MARPO_0089s0042 [Marchantia polymorpha]